MLAENYDVLVTQCTCIVLLYSCEIKIFAIALGVLDRARSNSNQDDRCGSYLRFVCYKNKLFATTTLWLVDIIINVMFEYISIFFNLTANLVNNWERKTDE